MEIWNKLRELRESKGLTYKALSKDVDISEPTLKAYESKSEKNRRPISKRNVIILSKYFGVSKEYLLYEDVMNKTSENININEKLGLSDKTIDIIKNISTIKTGISLEDHSYKDKTYTTMFNYFIENFENLQPFLSNLYYLKGNCELLENLKDVQYFSFSFTFLIDNFYNDKSKFIQITSLIEEKLSNVISLYTNGSKVDFVYPSEVIDMFIDYKNDLIERLKKRNMTKVNKKQIFLDLNELLDISMEMSSELLKTIHYYQYRLSTIINEFINGLCLDKDVFNSEPYDIRIKEIYEEYTKKEKKYTEEELKKYSLSWNDIIEEKK